MLLEIKNLEVYYDAIHALQNLSLEVDRGEVVTLIGANGAGKTTTLRTISGLVRAKGGGILFDGHDLLAEKPHNVVGLGISHVPEGRRVFSQLSVRENLVLGAYTRRKKHEIEENLHLVLNRFPRLRERLKQAAGTLSGGEQQMLAIGRGLMSRPRLLLLDEPSMGLAPIIVEQVYEVIREISIAGITILLVEQNAQMALSVAHRGYVLQSGRLVLSGSADELLADPAVQEAYLGETDEMTEPSPTTN
ncbi:MAG: ABC transporter ATP-binding protein [Deltaproteobacteria bacterium]|nr:ABC transporter ATP-binding protein [Deltaproteobacteria bacterium]